MLAYNIPAPWIRHGIWGNDKSYLDEFDHDRSRRDITGVMTGWWFETFFCPSYMG